MTSLDSGHFSNSYKAEQEISRKYYQDAVIDFTKKLNIAIKNHSDLKFLAQSCGGCDVVLPEFDDYLKSQLPRKNYGVSVVKFFDENVSGNLSPDNQKKLNTLIAGMLTTIIEDADYLIQAQHDIDGNSSHDLMDDVQKILRLLLKDPPQYDGYVDTMRDDAPGLITGRFETGQWAQGERYEIDLASDVASALGEKSSDASSDGGTEESTDDCESGFCTTLDIIYNDQYSVEGDGRNYISANLEEIFGSALDWLIKKGDKRNLACKAPTGINFFQSRNDQNLSFKNIFRGLGIFVFQKTPKYAQPIKAGEKTEKSAVQRERDTDAIIAASHKNYNINPDNLLLYTQKQLVEEATPIASKAVDSAKNQEQAIHRQKIQRNTYVLEKRREAVNADESTKNLFRFVGSSIQQFGTMVKDLLDISKVLKNKPDCGN